MIKVNSIGLLFVILLIDKIAWRLAHCKGGGGEITRGVDKYIKQYFNNILGIILEAPQISCQISGDKRTLKDNWKMGKEHNKCFIFIERTG